MSATATPVNPAGLLDLSRPRWSAGWVGFALLCLVALPCFLTLPISLGAYQEQHVLSDAAAERAPSLSPFFPMGTDSLERNLFWRVMLGGAISLGIGLSAAAISVTIGVLYGATSALVGGRVDSAMMRVVDVLYGLPYILLVVLLNIALQPFFQGAAGLVIADGNAAQQVGGILTLLIAIGGVSWLTMARVIRGQVLSLREQPFVESARAIGAGTPHILTKHMLPNLLGPIIVYATLTVPQAILQESFLSFLGIGVQPPLPSWGNLASNGLPELYKFGMGTASGGASGGGGGTINWWLIVFPCVMLGVTLMALNFLGDALRNHFDPKSRTR